MKVFNIFIKIILIILVILFAVYVWPTPYRNMPSIDRYWVESSPFTNVPFRIHRITGIGEVWYKGEWRKY
jgi:hypothetical protein